MRIPTMRAVARRILRSGKIDLVIRSKLFDQLWYEQKTGEKFKSLRHAVRHYLQTGERKGLSPHPLFEITYYRLNNPDVADSKSSLLVDYIRRGATAGCNPHPLFDIGYYFTHNPDVKFSGAEPLRHYLEFGGYENRDPHPMFQSQFYLNRYTDVAAAGINPLVHYLWSGALEGRDPNPDFSSKHYLTHHPDVAAAGLNPLLHYVWSGEKEGRTINNGGKKETVSVKQGETHTPTHAQQGHKHYKPPVGLLPWFSPMNTVLSAQLAMRPRLNVLIPGMAMRAMSGGPNTALNFVFRLAAAGIPIRFISTDVAPDVEHEAIWAHCRQLSGVSADTPLDLEIADASNKHRPLFIGENDIFFATAWWTAQMARYAVKQTKQKAFFYFIQDYEPIFHEGSTQKSLAEETYDLDIIPIVNTKLLFDYFVEYKIGKFKNPDFVASAVYFEPALDTQHFYHMPEEAGKKKRLLFYARPKLAPRNLFQLGIAALQKIIADGIIDPNEWEFIGMGEQFTPVDLGAGAVLRPAPWLGFQEYARQIRESTVLLSLMQSPHPSYPPIEMAASGRPAVTTEYANKTAESLRAISPNIIAAPAAIEPLADALCRAINMHYRAHEPITQIAYPSDWHTAFQPILPAVIDRIKDMIGLQRLPEPARIEQSGNTGFIPGFDRWPENEYALHRIKILAERRQAYPKSDAALFSLLTTVWDTAPQFLYELAETVFSQTSGTGFEWIILDNGSTSEETRAALQDIAQHPSVTLLRVNKNLGIIGGMNHVLQRATRRYIVPLDSDDLLTPDCLSILASALKSHGFPKLAYSDEDKLLGTTFRDPYHKPGWDPVLFFHSCYIAHICAIDRELLIQLGGYTDQKSKGCHDWDSFTRFYNAGHTPLHIPEVLYSWRMHEHSTAGNIDSKDYIKQSHKNVLSQFIAGQKLSKKIDIEHSPLFGQNPDWRYVHANAEATPIVSIIMGTPSQEPIIWTQNPLLHHKIHEIDGGTNWQQQLLEIAISAKRNGELLHLLSSSVSIDDPLWHEEAVTLMALFPDTAIAGGRLHRGGQIQAADVFWDVCDGIHSPNNGRTIQDPGYFAQMWKPHSCNAVPAQHCVVRPDIVIQTLELLKDTTITMDGLGIWLGRTAQLRGQRVIYSPFISARVADGANITPSVTEHNAQLLIDNERTWPLHLGTTQLTAYKPILSADQNSERTARRERAHHALMDIEAGVLARKFTVKHLDSSLTLSILTSVWEKTPPALFQKTVDSLLKQSHPFSQWVILENGPVSDQIADQLTALQSDPRIKRLRIARNIGIMGAMQHCLEFAMGDIVMPMDADDILTSDALACIMTEFEKTGADFVFSDEALLKDEQIVSPFIRSGFDPILNANDSCIWHACAFNRRKAIELGIYSDKNAEFCHDWDSITRFERGGCRIAHIPHILYLWRIHTQSSSNSGSVNEGSLASVRHVLQQRIDHTQKPYLYQIAPFPMWRGAEQLAILRNPIEPTPVTIIILGLGSTVPAPPNTLSGVITTHNIKIIGIPNAFTDEGRKHFWQQVKSIKTPLMAVMSEGCVPDSADGMWEAMRLFEMHPDVAITGGRLYNGGGIVISAATPMNSYGKTSHPFLGKTLRDAGVYAGALKPQSALDVPADYYFARTEFMKIAGNSEISALALAEISTALGTYARTNRKTAAYSPIIQARVIVTNPHHQEV